jgi:hypothetical protein
LIFQNISITRYILFHYNTRLNNYGEIINRSFVPPRGMAQSMKEFHTLR